MVSRSVSSVEDVRSERRVSISEVRPLNLTVVKEGDGSGEKKKSSRYIMTIEEKDEFVAMRRERRTNARSITFVGLGSDIKKRGMMKEETVTTAPRSSSGSCSPHSTDFDDTIIKRRSERFHIGFADTVGRRKSMEDSIFVLGQAKYNINMDIFGLFDGHGGPHVSRYAQNCFPVLAENRIKRNKIKPIMVLEEVFRDIQEGIIANKISGGSTALVTLVVDETCYVANLGDSRAVYGHGGQAERITNDHNPSNPAERDRIIENGGTITEHVTTSGQLISRINNALAVSRCFGDVEFTQWILSDPEIHQFQLQEDGFLILGCDGLWDVMDDQEAVDICDQFLSGEDWDIEDACIRLRDVAYNRGSTDNISVMVIKPLSLEEVPKKSKDKCIIS
eukprot:TRINITY_DN799_c0_g2_i2.p1 TRINITY_DN799_c0_g2~~TRINITY_DN799_c0_g2_i2.p1  ORF type:complete len:392 (+),score=86.93 TRINITY_DN799_c0_g2_i2:999-2174(+)